MNITKILVIDKIERSLLYKEFDKVIENEKYVNKEYIAKIYYNFYLKLLDDAIINLNDYKIFFKNFAYLDCRKQFLTV